MFRTLLSKTIMNFMVVSAFMLQFVPSLSCQENTNEYFQMVFEIYNQDKELIGTGTSISFSGLIITAKHVLIDHSESGGSNYLLKVLVRRYQSSDFEQAELLSIHPFMDLAILAKRTGSLVPPLPTRSIEGLTIGGDIILIGHRKSGNDLYKAKAAKIDKIDRNGHILAGRMVEKGTSGGPAIVDSKMVGVIRSTGADETTIVPIDRALDYFQLRGIKFSEDGTASESDDIAKLASKVETYEQILVDIQMDVEWYAEMKPVYISENTGTFPDDITIGIWYQKRLSTQRNFKARTTIQVIPIFANASFDVIDEDQRRSFMRSNWLIPKDDGIVKLYFDNCVNDILAIIESDYQEIGIREGDFIGFDVYAKIGSIPSEGFVKRPQDRTLIFKLRKNPGDKEFVSTVQVAGSKSNYEEW